MADYICHKKQRTEFFYKKENTASKTGFAFGRDLGDL